MGTTITLLAVVNDAEGGETLALANVGDSRTYLFRHERLRRVTVDHSYVQELVDTGHITADEARHHPRRNIVTRALGIDPSVQIDAWTLPHRARRSVPPVQRRAGRRGHRRGHRPRPGHSLRSPARCRAARRDGQRQRRPRQHQRDRGRHRSRVPSHRQRTKSSTSNRSGAADHPPRRSPRSRSKAMRCPTSTPGRRRLRQREEAPPSRPSPRPAPSVRPSNRASSVPPKFARRLRRAPVRSGARNGGSDALSRRSPWQRSSCSPS